MQEKSKTKKQLLDELAELRRHFIKLQKLQTKQKRAEESLRENELYLKAILSSIQAGVMVIEAEKHKIVDVNEIAAELIGSPKEQIIGRICHEYVCPAEKGKCPITDLKQVIDNAERILIGINGKKIPIIKTVVPIILKNRTYLLESFIDITERKKAEESLKDRETFLQLQFNRMPIGCITWDLDFRVVSWNPTAEKIFGFTEEEAKEKHPYDIIVPKVAQAHVDSIWQRLLEGDITAHSENENITKDGRIIICYWVNTPLKQADGKVIGVISMVQDVTERKKAEAVLRQSEEKFRSLAEQSPNMIFINYKGRVVYANQKCEEIMGYSKDEFYSERFNFRSIIAPEYLDLVSSAFQKHMQGEEVLPYEYAIVTRAGKRMEVIITTKLIDYENDKAILGIITDITERKKNEEEMRNSKEELGRRIKELEDFYDMAVGRELRMKQLKEEIAELKEELEKYKKS